MDRDSPQDSDVENERFRVIPLGEETIDGAYVEATDAQCESAASRRKLAAVTA